MSDQRYQSWGRYPKVKQQAFLLRWRGEALSREKIEDQTFLPYGNGRSYGDVCLNEGGFLADCRGLNRFISFNSESGVLKCEAGVLLSEILNLAQREGWFLPVVPGTQFVTVGGAIANDVHGKNHHRVGTFGCYVRQFELSRSDGTLLRCSPQENAGFYQATIGGLGLTGIITWAELQLVRVGSSLIEHEVIRYRDFDEFFHLADDSNDHSEYTMAWIDCLAKGKNLGRGLFVRGNHVAERGSSAPKVSRKHLTFPIDPPFALVNGITLKAFNSLYYWKQRSSRVKRVTHYEPFLFPLDSLRAWNRLYGKRGFLQYQCVVPMKDSRAAIKEMLERIAKTGKGSFLAVLKVFGDKPSPGFLSFPMHGTTLALDFPNQGQKTLDLLEELDLVVIAAGGRINPSKDARMLPENFQKSYQGWEQMNNFTDPAISSSFWRRVTTSS